LWSLRANILSIAACSSPVLPSHVWLAARPAKLRVLSQSPIQPAREIRSGAAQCSDYHQPKHFRDILPHRRISFSPTSVCCKHSHPSPFLPSQCALSYIASPHRILADSAASLSTAAVCLQTRTILLPRLVVSQCTWKSSHCPASAGPVSPKSTPPLSIDAQATASQSDFRLNSNTPNSPPHPNSTGLGHSLEEEARVQYSSTQPASCR
jgi:hypothetical protein